MASQKQRVELSALLKPVAWLLLVAVIVVTVVPAEFRPTTPLPLKVERALGFAVLTFVFTIAYPQRWLSILLVMSAGAIGLELLQFAVPSRDPSPVDAIVKVMGAVIGVAGGRVARQIVAAFGYWRS